MHLEQQRMTVGKLDGKTPFIIVLMNSGDACPDYFFEEVNAISSCPVKNIGERKARKRSCENAFDE
jgi:hypothetical protein